jgi:hypothetical protein
MAFAQILPEYLYLSLSCASKAAITSSVFTSSSKDGKCRILVWDDDTLVMQNAEHRICAFG